LNFELNLIEIGRLYHIAAESENWWKNNMKQIIASAFYFWKSLIKKPLRGYYDFSQKFVSQGRRRFRRLLNSITRRVDLAMSVCPFVHLSVRLYTD